MLTIFYIHCFKDLFITFILKECKFNALFCKIHDQNCCNKFVNMKVLIFVTIGILCLMVKVHTENYTLFLTSQANGAACLDGSPHGLYIYEGKNTNKDNFIVYFQGGGYCGSGNLSDTLESCYSRSNGELGSTKVLSVSRSFDNAGILSTDPSMNPDFYDWTKVIVNYCDGSEYFGSRP